MLKRANLVVFLTRALAASGFLILNLVLAKLYSVEAVGVISSFISMVVILSALARFGVDNASIKILSISFHRALFDRVWLLYLTLSLLLVLTVLPASYAVSVTSDQFFSVCFFIVLFYTLCVFNGSVFKSIGFPGLSACFEPGFVALVLSVILIVVNGYDIDFYISYSLILCAFSLLGFIVLTFILSPKSIVLDGLFFSELKSIFQLMPSFAFLSVTGFLIQWLGTPMVNYLSGAEEAGLFSLAFRVTMGISFILVVITSVIQPKLSFYNSEKDFEKLKQLVKVATKKSFILGGGVAFITAVLSPVVFYYYLDIKEGSFYIALFILIFSQLVNVCTGPVGTLLNMAGEHKYMVRMSCYSLFAMFFLSLCVVPYWGAIGGAVASGCALCMQNLFAYKRANKFLANILIER